MTVAMGLAQENSIGFLRLLLALLVLFGHSFSFGGHFNDPLVSLTNDQIAVGRFPVDVFFALSGYLISQSLSRCSSPTQYLWHRFIRIYPAYWFCIAFTGTIVSFYFTGVVDVGYIFNNLLLINGTDQSIDGLFVGNPSGTLVNGSLWTLPWELRAYFLLLLISYAGGLRGTRFPVVCFMVCWMYFCYQLWNHSVPGDRTVITSWYRLMTFFFAGAVVYSYRHTIRLSGLLAWAALGILVCGTWLSAKIWQGSGGLFYVLAPVCLTYLCFWLGSLKNFAKINSKFDVSYGVYIYGSVVLQSIAALKIDLDYVSYLILSVSVTLMLAIVSWYGMERPALRLKDLFERNGRPH